MDRASEIAWIGNFGAGCLLVWASWQLRQAYKMVEELRREIHEQRENNS